MLIRLSRATILGCVLAISSVALVAGCGGGGGKSSAENAAAIRQSWEEFFDGSTSSARRISLLENGERFAKTIEAVGGSPLAKQVKAKVTSVKIDGPKTATVTFSLLLGKTTVLKGVKGSAVLVDGAWKVQAKSFCQLALLQGAVPDACPPAGK
jgi:hypothetical protein